MYLISCIFATAESQSRTNNFTSWANLPPDLLRSIVDRLDITDSIRLSAVCTSWASTIRQCSLPSLAPFRLNRHIPLLLLSANNSKTDPNWTSLYLYNLTTATSYSVPIPTPIPSHCFCHWLGHKDGWLVTLDAQSQLHLIKPLTGAHILLPSKGLYYEHLRKVILCRTPDRNNGFVAVCISQLGCLALAKTGADSWTSMKDYPFHDVILYKGKVYAIASDIISCWSFLGSSFRHERLITLGLGQKFYRWPKYLAEWRGELVMLIANKDPWFSFQDEELRKVRLYKINLNLKGGRSSLLSRVRSLGDDALFLGANHSYAVSTSGIDHVRGNCIYFAAVRMQAFDSLGSSPINFSFGVFDLRKKTYKYKKCLSRHDSPNHWQPPIWFRPC